MADETVTDATNSEAAAIQTDASAATDTTTSTTETTAPNSDSQQDAASDDLDGDTLLGADADAGADGEGGDDAGEGDSDGDAGGDEPAALLGAPEGDYELDLGEDATFDIAKDDLDKITPLAKEIGLSNAGLSRLANETVPLIQGAVQRAMIADVVETRKAWENDARAFVQGGKLADGTEIEASSLFAGETMETVTNTAARAIDRFTKDADGNPILFPGAKVGENGVEPGTFRDWLKTTGMGNHPAMLQFAYLAGKMLGEDSDFERGGDVPQTKLTREQKYYPHRN